MKSGPVTKAAYHLVSAAQTYDAAANFEETAAAFRAIMSALNRVLRAIKPADIEAAT